MFVTSATKNLKECIIAKFDSNWTYSRACGSLLVLASHPHHSPPLTLRLKLNINELIYNVKSTNSTIPSRHPSHHTIQYETKAVRSISVVAIHLWSQIQ